MSYINNNQGVTSHNREQVAKIYYSVCISEVPPGLSGRKLVEATIGHIFQWGLKSTELKNEGRQFLAFAFRITEFLFILDIGTIEDFIRCLDDILSHPAFLGEYKRLFLKKIYYANMLNEDRITLREGKSRKEYYARIRSWLARK